MTPEKIIDEVGRHKRDAKNEIIYFPKIVFLESIVWPTNSINKHSFNHHSTQIIKKSYLILQNFNRCNLIFLFPTIPNIIIFLPKSQAIGLHTHLLHT